MRIGQELHSGSKAEVNFDGPERIQQAPGIWRTLTRRPAVKHTHKSLRTGSDVVNALALIVVGIVVMWTLVPGWFTAYDPLVGDVTAKFLPPGFSHWFGTDRAGRDTFTRVVYGTHNTVFGAIIGTAIGLSIGSTIGVVAGVVSPVRQGSRRLN